MPVFPHCSNSLTCFVLTKRLSVDSVFVCTRVYVRVLAFYRETKPIGCRIWRKMYFKELAHAIMEADKFQNLQSASRRPSCVVGYESRGLRPRRIDDVAPVWRPAGSRPKKSQCLSLSPKAEKVDVSVWRPSGRKNCLLLRGGWAFLFYSGLQLIKCDPLTLGRAICFTQSANLNLNLIQTPSQTYP